MQAPTSITFSRRVKPEIKLQELFDKSLIQDGFDFAGGFGGSVVFAKKKLKDIEPIFRKTDIWMALFTLVNLHYKGVEDLTEGLIGFARAEAEEKEGLYEVSKVSTVKTKVSETESVTSEMKVVVRLKPGDENKNRGLYFKAFHAEFGFQQQGDDVLFSVKMLYSRSVNPVMAWFQDKMMAGIKVVMKEALKQCMNTAWTRVCDYEAYKQKELMAKQKIISLVPARDLKLRNYDYGVRGTWTVPAQPKDVREFLANSNNYKDIHERFTSDNPGLVKLTFLECGLNFVLTTEKNKIILTAADGILAISRAQFVFDLKAKGNETEVTVDFNYSMGWFLGMFEGTVRQLAGKVITTILRHLAMGFVPAATPTPTQTSDSLRDVTAHMAV